MNTEQDGTFSWSDKKFQPVPTSPRTPQTEFVCAGDLDLLPRPWGQGDAKPREGVGRDKTSKCCGGVDSQDKISIKTINNPVCEGSLRTLWLKAQVCPSWTR